MGVKKVRFSTLQKFKRRFRFRQRGAEQIKHSRSVVIIPGYGMAVAQAQHVVREIVAFLREQQVDVKFAIHPVAGRLRAI